MRIVLAALALLFASLLASPATAQSGASLTGEWSGVYAGGGNVATEFELELRDDAGRLNGATTERNTFGTSDAMFLLATISGQRSGDSLRFTKTYDGTGGQSHSVQYSGRIMPGGRRIVGTWTIDTQTGQFEMVR